MARNKFIGLKRASKLLPENAREDFIAAFKLTQEPDVYEGHMACYMRDIRQMLETREHDSGFMNKKVEKAISILEEM